MGVYCPTSAISEALEKIRNLWSTYRSSELLIVGDLKWFSSISDGLKDLCLELNLLSADIQTELNDKMKNLA